MISFIANVKAEIAVVAVVAVIAAAYESLTGQLLVALIAALPPTGAVIVALIALKRGQKEMTIMLDGKLEKLMAAEKGVSKAEGVKEEREDAREREVMNAPTATAAIIAATVAAVLPPGRTPVSKVEVVNDGDNPVPVKPLKKDILL